VARTCDSLLRKAALA